MVLENRVATLSRDASFQLETHTAVSKKEEARLRKELGRREEQHLLDVKTAAGLKAAVADANSRMMAAQVREQRQRAALTTDSVNDGRGVHVYNRTAWYVRAGLCTHPTPSDSALH